ncbi:hypothetical protein AMECASPLE_031128 [Ameca splendens]|uniref:Uncharacterized protein n=1 Tax=Ameca splendens TaxID=208324 RepID=A0ABV0YHQ8_9TELE
MAHGGLWGHFVVINKETGEKGPCTEPTVLDAAITGLSPGPLTFATCLPLSYAIRYSQSVNLQNKGHWCHEIKKKAQEMGVNRNQYHHHHSIAVIQGLDNETETPVILVWEVSWLNWTSLVASLH